jgi:hypothetical protein
MISIQRVGTRVGTQDAGPVELKPRLTNSKVGTQDAAPVKLKPRLTKSKVAKPLLTSLAGATLLAGGSFAAVAATSTGSLQPWHWSHASWSGATIRYQACTQQVQGMDVFGCMLSLGVKPASAADAAAGAGAHRGAPRTSVVTIHDPAPAGPAGPAAPPAANPGSTHSAGTGTGSTAGSGSHHVVNPPRTQPQPSPQPTSGDDGGGRGGD